MRRLYDFLDFTEPLNVSHTIGIGGVSTGLIGAYIKDVNYMVLGVVEVYGAIQHTIGMKFIEMVKTTGLERKVE
jgi:hypothetical protein